MRLAGRGESEVDVEAVGETGGRGQSRAFRLVSARGEVVSKGRRGARRGRDAVGRDGQAGRGRGQRSVVGLFSDKEKISRHENVGR